MLKIVNTGSIGGVTSAVFGLTWICVTAHSDGAQQALAVPTLRSVFPQPTASPPAIILTPQTRAALRADPRYTASAITALLDESDGSSDLTFFVFRDEFNGPILCQVRHTSQWGPADPYFVEIITDLDEGLLGTAKAIKAVRVRTYRNVDLSAFGHPAFRGPAVVGAFTSDQVRSGRYIAFYKKKTIREVSPEAPEGAPPHLHTQTAWGVLSTG